MIEAFIITMRRSDLRPEAITPGSQPINCSRCGHGCVLSPETDAATRLVRAAAVCVRCLTAADFEGMAGNVQALTWGQVRELVAGLAPSHPEGS